MGKDLPEFEDKVIKGKKYPVAFAIRHFGTVVPYCIDGFCDKNADPLDKVMLELMQLCHDSDKATDFSRRLFEQPSSDRRSLAFKFRDEMDRLVQTLEKCSGHFVRCIKPNDERKAFVLDPKTCTPQLQSCGVLEAAKVAQAVRGGGRARAALPLADDPCCGAPPPRDRAFRTASHTRSSSICSSSRMRCVPLPGSASMRRSAPSSPRQYAAEKYPTARMYMHDVRCG
jgi:hypothetical protein